MSVVLIALSYLIGSISSSTLCVKWVAHLNIRQFGSGNAGATNTLRALGLKWALIVFAFDILKGIVVIVLARELIPGVTWVEYACGITVVIGHDWPVFFKFHGGKGVATSIGVLALMMFFPAVIAGVICILVIALTRYVSLGSLLFVSLTVTLSIPFLHSWSLTAFSVVIATLVVFQHRQNILRLLHGKENKLVSGAFRAPRE